MGKGNGCGPALRMRRSSEVASIRLADCDSRLAGADSHRETVDRGYDLVEGMGSIRNISAIQPSHLAA